MSLLTRLNPVARIRSAIQATAVEAATTAAVDVSTEVSQSVARQTATEVTVKQSEDLVENVRAGISEIMENTYLPQSSPEAVPTTWAQAVGQGSETLTRRAGSSSLFDHNTPVFGMNDPQRYRDAMDPRMRPFRLVTVDTLRHLAETYDPLAACIAHLKSEVIRTPLRFTPKDDEDKSEETKKQIKAAQEFFLETDGGLGGLGKTRAAFEGEFLDDLIVIGCSAIYLDYDTRGSLREQNPDAAIAIDASTIRPLITPFGFIPEKDSAVYEQVVQGVSWRTYQRHEMFYEGLPEYARSHSPYFVSMVELVVMVVYTALKSDEWNRTWLTHGNTPDEWMKMPETMTPDQAQDWLRLFKQMMAGNSRQRHQVKLTPGEITGKTGRKDSDFQEFDFWLRDRVCSVMGVNPASIGYHSRQYKDSQGDAMDSTRENRVPSLVAFRNYVYNYICKRKGWSNIRATDQEPGEEDATARASRYKTEIEAGIRSPNECRVDMGEEPYEGGDTRFISAQLVPISQALAPPAPAPVPGGSAPGDTEDVNNARAANEANEKDAKAAQALAAQGANANRPAKPTVARADLEPSFARGAKHQFSCVMLELHTGHGTQGVIDWARWQFPEHKLVQDGVEEYPHVTVLYGLHAAEPEAVVEAYHDWCRENQATGVTIRVGNFAVFRKQEPEAYDVLVYEIESEQLHSLNAALAKLPHTNSFKDYRPHLTIAYVLPGAADYWEGKSGPMTGQTLYFQNLLFSSKDGGKYEVGHDSQHASAEEIKRVLEELGKWERKCLNRLARGQSVVCRFESDVIPNELQTVIFANLEGRNLPIERHTKDSIQTIFDVISEDVTRGEWGEILARGFNPNQPRGVSGPGTTPGSFMGVEGRGGGGGTNAKKDVLHPSADNREKGKAFWQGVHRDETTSQLFNGKFDVNVRDAAAVGALSKEYFGRELAGHEWGQLIGAPDGSYVSVRPQGKSVVEVSLKHGDYFKKAAITHVIPDTEGVTANNSFVSYEFVEKTGDAPERLIPRMLAYEFKKCDELDIDLVTLQGAGYKDHPKGYTGYSRWPQLGFDAHLESNEIASLPPGLAGTETLGELMQKDGGFEWWEEHGSGRQMDFDLTPGSTSRRIFDAYLKSRNIRID